jgi:hypothetical protein
MTHFFLYFLNNSSTVEKFNFIPVSEDPPFPFNLDYSWRLCISAAMSFILVSGIFLRKIIISYLLAPDTNTGPINLLIWVDQVNGLFLALNILGRIIAFVLPFPLSVLTGDTFC